MAVCFPSLSLTPTISLFLPLVTILAPFHVSQTSFVCLDYLYSGYPDDLLVLAIPLVVKLWRHKERAENSAHLAWNFSKFSREL